MTIAGWLVARQAGEEASVRRALDSLPGLLRHEEAGGRLIVLTGDCGPELRRLRSIPGVRYVVRVDRFADQEEE